MAMLLFLWATGIAWSLYAGATVSDIRAEFGWQRPQLDRAVATARYPVVVVTAVAPAAARAEAAFLVVDVVIAGIKASRT